MNPMVIQIQSIPRLIHDVVPRYDEAVRSTLTPELCRSVERIYLTGSGDSHHACLGAELAFEQLAGIPTEALTSLQFARYAVETLPEPEKTLVIGVSVSGEVARTLEGLLRARKAGAVTLALTANSASRIGQAARWLIDTTQPAVETPPGVVIPGMRSYVANQIALLLTAIRLGEARGRLSAEEAGVLRREIATLAYRAEWTIASNDRLAMELVQNWQNADEFVFVGGGPNYASALFAAAKVLEASGDTAIGQDTEEWAHLQYFARAVSTPTFLITAGERDLSRAVEVAEAARAVGRRLVAVTPLAAAGVIAANASPLLPLPEGVREMFAPVISAIPTYFFAAYRAERINEPFFRGFGGGRSPEGGGGISRIRTSEILDD